MARIKGGLNAKKKHNRVLKLAKGSDKCIRWKKTEKTSVQTAVDRSYQRSSKNERTVLQQIYVRPETGWC